MTPIIFFIFILVSCHGLEFNSRARNFSIELLDSTGLDNFVIAPFNLWCLMAGAGLWTNGETQEQISKILRLPKNKTIFLNEYTNLKRTIFDETSAGVDISNGIFIYTRNDFNIFPAFRETMTTYFEAVIKELNFEDTKKAAKEADDLITTKLQSVFNVFRPDDFVYSTMIMSSVISFSGQWKSEFNVSHTTIESYSFENDSDIYLVQKMHKRLKLPYSKMESLNADVMELAIGEDGKFCLLLILPYQGADIKEVYKKLYEVTLKDIFDKLQRDVNEFGLREIDLKLPKFKIVTGIVLNKPLSDIGLRDVFEPGKNKFGIARNDIYISSIVHACQVVINEKGVYAIASTPGYSDYHIETKLEAEQPFLFFVMEKSTQTIMFGGLYSKALYVIKK